MCKFLPTYAAAGAAHPGSDATEPKLTDWPTDWRSGVSDPTHKGNQTKRNGETKWPRRPRLCHHLTSHTRSSSTCSRWLRLWLRLQLRVSLRIGAKLWRRISSAVSSSESEFTLPRNYAKCVVFGCHASVGQTVSPLEIQDSEERFKNIGQAPRSLVSWHRNIISFSEADALAIWYHLNIRLSF